MDVTDTSGAMSSLEALKRTAIAELGPDLTEPSTRVVHGLVTITWPYNSVKNSFAFILAEPDFRIRRNKGQVRLNFTGAAAKAAGTSGIGSNDELLVSLEGATWEASASKTRLSIPDANIDWQMTFSQRASLKITSGETGETKYVTVDDASFEQPSQQIPETLTNDSSPTEDFIAPTFPAQTPVKDTRVERLAQDEFESPAFIKRARLSYGSLFEGGYDIFEDDGGVKGQGRKRTKFGEHRSAWRYSSQSASPEPPKSPDGEAINPAEKPAESSPKPAMADEACQTMELDATTSPPTSTAIQKSDEVRPSTAQSQVPATHFRETMTQRADQLLPMDSTDPADATANTTSTAPTLFADPALDTNPFQSARQFPPSIGASESPWNTAQNAFTPAPSSNPLFMHPQIVEETFSGELGTPFPSQQMASFHATGSRSQSHSPGRAGYISEYPDPVGSGGDEVGINVDEDHPVHAAQPATIYPSLENVDEVVYGHLRDETSANYPSSYLENTRVLPPSDADREAGPFSGVYSDVAHMARSSWATINTPSQATAMPPTGRLASRGGSTSDEAMGTDESDSAMPRTDGLASSDGSAPDQALVIDESDSDADPEPPPVAVEDTVLNGRADALEMYEDAEVEDEVDTQFSDDDEPAYDADEMGGDYDARNYEGSEDDEDDIHDEDLRDHDLEPAFDDGRSWEEGDEDESAIDESDREFDSEYDSQYDMDEGEFEQQASQPRLISQSGPPVIDLISSSEDEEESEEGTKAYDDGTGEEGEDVDDEADAEEDQEDVGEEGEELAATQSAQRGSYKLANELAASQVPNTSSASHAGLVLPEQQGVGDQLEMSPEYGPPAETAELRPEDTSIQSRVSEIFEPEEVATAASSQHDEDLHQVVDRTEEEREVSRNETPEDDVDEVAEQAHMDTDVQSTSAAPQELLESVLPDAPISSLDNTAEDIDGQQSAAIGDHLSAADGLEMLSQVIEKESKAQQQAPPVEYDEEPSDKDSSMSEVQVVDDQDPVEIDHPAFHDTHDTIDPLPNDSTVNITDVEAEGQPQLDVGSKEPVAAAPSSPPLTHSFPSQIHEDQTETTLPESVAMQTDTFADQLPTPSDTQARDVGSTTIATEIVEMEVDEVVETPLQPTQSTVAQTLDDLLPTSKSVEHFTSLTRVEVTEGSSQELGDGDQSNFEILEYPANLDPHGGHPHEASPTLNSQTQADDDLVMSEHPLGLSSQAGNEAGSQPLETSQSTVQAVSASFWSQMEGDEELQASILEDSQLDGPSMGMSDGDASGNGQLSSRVQDRSSRSPEIQPTQAEGPSSRISSRRWQGLGMPHSSGQSDATASQPDTSVELARAANASRRSARRSEASSDISSSRRHTRLEAQRHASSEAEDSSIQLARASLNKLPPPANSSRRHTRLEARRHESSEAEDSSSQLTQASLHTLPKVKEDSGSMAAVKLNLVRQLAEQLPDCASLKVLRQHLTKSLDVIAVAMMQPPEPRRAAKGPREYLMSFTVTDHSIAEHDAHHHHHHHHDGGGVAEVQLHRPHKDSLPAVRAGDVVLLRNFTVVALPGKGFGLQSNDASSWAVFEQQKQKSQTSPPPPKNPTTDEEQEEEEEEEEDQEEPRPAQIRGPPVEYDARETTYVAYLREWFGLLDDTARELLEVANRRIVDAGVAGSSGKSKSGSGNKD
ncbi:hypothetical protein GGR56DRAFT_81124 [Xylariaceae sp. FL0804]|nr:hypothetical protein GGR56DRAFT_81124 [Xylariaceae sp. FL0804]